MQKVFGDHWVSASTLKRRSKHAEDCIMITQRSLDVETILSPEQQVRQMRDQQLKALMNMIIDLKFPQNGDTIFLPQRIRLHLRHHDGNQAATCGQFGTGIRGNLHPEVSSEIFSFFNCSR